MGVKQFTIPTIFTAIDRFSGPVRAMQNNMDRFALHAQAGLGRAERAFRNVTAPLTKLTNLLRYFGFFGGFALVAAVGGGIKIFADFEQANADLAAVLTNVTRPEMALLSKDAKRLGLSTARTATEVVGLQIELAKLGYTTTEILQMTGAIVTGSVAMDAALDRTALLAGAMIRTFDKFTSADTPRIMDQMTLATLDTALSFEKLETMLPIVSGAANAVNVPFSRLLALLGKLSDAGIDASSSATALRNIFIDSRRRGHGYEQVLQNIVKHADRLTPAFNKFGKRGAVSAVVLAGKLKEVAALDEKLINQSEGVAAGAAAKRLDTLTGSVTLLKSAYQGFIISVEDGKGPIGQMLTGWVRATRGMFLLASGTKEAMDVFNSLDEKTKQSSNRLLFWIKVTGYALAALVAMKVAFIAARVAMVGYSLWLGISSALTGVSMIAMAGNTLAITTQTVALWLMTTGLAAVTTAFRFLLLNLGPVGLALFAIITQVQSFDRNWNKINDAFKTKGILAGLDAISAALMDGVLYPLQKVFMMLSKLPGGKAYFEQAALGVQRTREFVGAEMNEDGGGPGESGRKHWSRGSSTPPINPLVDDMDRFLRQKATQDFDLNGKMTLEYTAPPGFNIKSQSDSLKVLPRVDSTMKF